jgi:hypothetical protein
MSLDTKLVQQAERMLAVVDEAGARGTRLQDEGRRLWQRVQKLLGMNLMVGEVDYEALEMACYALQLPMRQSKVGVGGRLGQVSLRERSEQAAELLVGAMGRESDAEMLDRATRLPLQMPARTPATNEAKVLADAVNLDDFGVTGLIAQAMQLARQHACVRQVEEGFELRQQYGYWEVRLKDGFHFEQVRELARRRLENARRVVELLRNELKEDGAL